MRPIYLLILCVAISGCASVPKEELRDIFNLAKNEKFDSAREKFESASSSSWTGQFDTYANQTIPSVNSPDHDDVSTLIASAKNHIEGCREKVSEAKKLSPHKPQADDEFDFNEKFRRLKDDFNLSCRKDIEKEWSSIYRIKKYSTVDLFPTMRATDDEFKAEVRRVNSEVAEIEGKAEKKIADNKAKKDAYEDSEEFYSKKLCEMDDRVKLGRTVIQRENEAGKISGIVDKNKLYEAGKVIQITNDRIKHFSAEYQTKFGKPWSASGCK